MAVLTSVAPRAAIGLTDEIRQKFELDPLSVMSDPESKDG